VGVQPKPPGPDATDRELLEAARGGDESAFQRLVERHRRDLHAHCYRMLGSLHDAEDALQEAMLRAWRGLPRFEGRSSLRTWLYTIATNTCLNAIARRPARTLPIDYGPPADPHDDREPVVESTWIEPYPDQQIGVADGLSAPEARYERRESVELAFVAALQHLPPRPRAVLILREVLGLSAREVAEALDTTIASVNSALQRARRTVRKRMPPLSQQATLRALGDERIRAGVEDYSDALERGDVDAVITMLTEDATWSMPPLPQWYAGHVAIAGFLERGPNRVRWRHLATRANGQLAVGCYAWDDDRGAYVASVLDVLTLRGDRIAAITAFLDPTLFAAFGLPEEHSTATVPPSPASS
jgi:RNA polymerase sigma-70 factor, ECF subfamily